MLGPATHKCNGFNSLFANAITRPRQKKGARASGPAVAALCLVFRLCLHLLLLHLLLPHRHALNRRWLFPHLSLVELFQKWVQIGYGECALLGSLKFSGCVLPQDMRPRHIMRGSCPGQKCRCLLSVVTLARHRSRRSLRPDYPKHKCRGSVPGKGPSADPQGSSGVSVPPYVRRQQIARISGLRRPF